MLNASLPPASCRTTRLRDTAPAARAMSTRNAGAAKLMVNAAMPSRKNSRRVTFRDMCVSLDELILARPRNDAGEPRRLGLHLRVGSRPRATGVQVRDQLARLDVRVRPRREPQQHRVEERFRFRLVRRAE